MPEKIIPALDSTTLLGTSSAGVGFAATFAQWYPAVTGTMAFIVMVMTIIHMYRRIQNSALEKTIKLQNIELNKRQLRRATDVRSS